MNRQEKKQEVEHLTKRLTEGSTIYLTDISGLDAQETSDLRRACFKADIKMSVVKNTLLLKAMASTDKNFGDLNTVVKGNTSLMFSSVGNSPAKLIQNFRKKSERPILKGAYINEDIYIGDENIARLASIKSKEEVIGEIIVLLQSPIKKVISSLQSGKDKLSGIVKTLSSR